MYKLVVVRHGESVWNKENIFTGWTDVGLSDLGREQAKEAGLVLNENNCVFDLAFTSVLVRATETLDIILKTMGMNITTEKSWRLNERHYGALQGMNKDEIKLKFGQEKFNQWRRSYDIQPIALTVEDARYPGKDEKYQDLQVSELPLTESLKDTEARVMPYWYEVIVPKILDNQNVLICAHGNSIRALAKNIEKISDQEIANLEIPLGCPIVYELDDDLAMVNKLYLL